MTKRGLPWSSWAFVLRDGGPESTRLVVRFRSDFAPGAVALLANKYALEPVHFLMEQRMLRGIRDRAERTAPVHS